MMGRGVGNTFIQTCPSTNKRIDVHNRLYLKTSLMELLGEEKKRFERIFFVETFRNRKKG